MNSLDQSLEWFASRPVDEDAVREAQRKLEALIASRQAKSRVVPRSRWLAVTASAAVAESLKTSCALMPPLPAPPPTWKLALTALAMSRKVTRAPIVRSK